MRCEKCGGPFYVDKDSVAELARYGYIGGRIHCLMGCTDLWLMKRADGADITPPENKQRPLIKVRCQDCGICFMTKGTNAKRCAPCRAAVHRQHAALAQRRYAHAHH